jgi:beta-galactosidase/beta-glucuronidase
MLFPFEAVTREVKQMSGFWSFQLDDKEEELKDEWFYHGLPNPEIMAVPSSVNEIMKDSSKRNFMTFGMKEISTYPALER